MGVDAEYLKKIVLNQLKQAGSIEPAPIKTQRNGKHYEILVGIGNDHTARVTLNEDALEALLSG